MEILLLAVCAMASGPEGWEAMEELSKANLDWLRKFAPFTNGVPPHERIDAVISRMSPKRFQACFCGWARPVANTTNGELVAVDGTRLSA